MEKREKKNKMKREGKDHMDWGAKYAINKSENERKDN